MHTCTQFFVILVVYSGTPHDKLTKHFKTSPFCTFPFIASFLIYVKLTSDETPLFKTTFVSGV